MTTSSPELCPLTRKPGHVIRQRKPAELAESYASYCGASLPAGTIDKYFASEVTEYYLESSGLRWYAPCNLGDGDYYSTLAAIYPWYYNPGSWDKLAALEIIKRASFAQVVEVGSGSGWFLSRLKEHKIKSFGVEINPKEVKACRKQGLTVYFPDEVPDSNSAIGCLCLFQTIEHVSDPVDFLKNYTRRFNPRELVLSAPCFESLLGLTKDPLSWPPHHATAWSNRAFETLASLLGYRVVNTSYSPLSYDEFESRLQREGCRKLPGLPPIPGGRLGHYTFRVARKLGFHWACRGHSILVVMRRII
jgi:SAM-dependent methyltransferase